MRLKLLMFHSDFFFFELLDSLYSYMHVCNFPLNEGQDIYKLRYEKKFYHFPLKIHRSVQKPSSLRDNYVKHLKSYPGRPGNTVLEGQVISDRVTRQWQHQVSIHFEECGQFSHLWIDAWRTHSEALPGPQLLAKPFSDTSHIQMFNFL